MGARLEEFEEEQIIIQEGKPNNRVYLIQRGNVVLYMNYGTPDEYVFRVCKKDDVFGETSMFSGEDSEFTAVAFTNVKVVWFERNNLNQFLLSYPDKAVGLMEKIMHNNVVMKKNFEMALQEVQVLKQQLENPDNTDKTLPEAEKVQINQTVNKGYYRYIDTANVSRRVSRITGKRYPE